MSQRIILFLILFQCLLIKSQKFTFIYQPITLTFDYINNNYWIISRYHITTRPTLKLYVNNSYILTGETINDTTLLINSIKCQDFVKSRESCDTYFESSYISLVDFILTEDYVFKIENVRFKQLIRTLAYRNNFKLYCYLLDINSNYIEKPKDPYGYPLSKTSLFGIICLSACIALIFLVCIGWFGVIYYRQFKQYLIKKKLRKALEQSTQEILNKSPIIIFDSNNKNEDILDDDPMCAICLESFKSKEKIRKLVCAHYFHITCIDPWLLSRQSCPLCNRNILRNSIPSISSSVMAVINERDNDGTSSIANNNQIVPTQI